MPDSPDLSLPDLLAAAASGTAPGGDPPPRVAVIGHPVGHSLSPAMHQPALDARGLAIRYVRVDVPPGSVADAFRAMHELGFAGCNVTVPHKGEALEACHEVDPFARLVGAVNTVIFRPAGIEGANTDGPGLAAAVEEAFGRPLAAHRVAILGAGGGAGRAAAMQCALAGCPALTLVNRTAAKAEAVAADILGATDLLDIGIAALGDATEVRDALAPCNLLINATSLGLKEGDPSPVHPAALHPGLAVYDMIYQPPVTPLLAAARAAGCRTANGLSMLVHQGALSFIRWFGGTPPIEAMRRGVGAAG